MSVEVEMAAVPPSQVFQETGPSHLSHLLTCVLVSSFTAVLLRADISAAFIPK